MMITIKKCLNSHIAVVVSLIFLGFTLSKLLDDYAIYRTNVTNLTAVHIETNEEQVILDFMLDCYGSLMSNYTTCVNDAEEDLIDVEFTSLISFFDKTSRPYIFYANASSLIWTKNASKG